jgi:hypothetical protein
MLIYHYYKHIFSRLKEEFIMNASATIQQIGIQTAQIKSFFHEASSEKNRTIIKGDLQVVRWCAEATNNKVVATFFNFIRELVCLADLRDDYKFLKEKEKNVTNLSIGINGSIADVVNTVLFVSSTKLISLGKSTAKKMVHTIGVTGSVAYGIIGAMKAKELCNTISEKKVGWKFTARVQFLSVATKATQVTYFLFACFGGGIPGAAFFGIVSGALAHADAHYVDVLKNQKVVVVVEEKTKQV